MKLVVRDSVRDNGREYTGNAKAGIDKLHDEFFTERNGRELCETIDVVRVGSASVCVAGIFLMLTTSCQIF